MPYRITKVSGGFKVKTPNHPNGFSKRPLTREQAVKQLQAIKANANPETESISTGPVFANNVVKDLYNRRK